MGAYIYRVLPPSQTRVIEVDGTFYKAGVAVYAFKPFRSWDRVAEKLNARWFGLCEAWGRSWKGRERPKYVVIAYVPDGQKFTAKTPIKGSRVIEWTRAATYFYDDPDWEGQPVLGEVGEDGSTIRVFARA